MITRDTLATYIDHYLACESFNDYAPNGLQVAGKESIKRICSAVTASAEVISQAVAMQADALLVHHGYFWRDEQSVITGIKHRRISQLITHDLNLYAYHLPLDCHPEIGNNAGFAKLLGVEQVQMHTVGKIANILWSGKLLKSCTAKELSGHLSDKLNRQPLYINATDKNIATVAWCTGGAQDFIVNAAALGVDAYLSGEISERTYHEAKELGLHYFACGHHATERSGIQALGQHLAKQFNLHHQFIDCANPV